MGVGARFWRFDYPSEIYRMSSLQSAAAFLERPGTINLGATSAFGGPFHAFVEAQKAAQNGLFLVRVAPASQHRALQSALKRTVVLGRCSGSWLPKSEPLAYIHIHSSFLDSDH